MLWFTSHTGDSASREFFVTSVDGKFARIYPLRIWNEVEKRLLGTVAQR
jgi:hypothetical protein